MKRFLLFSLISIFLISFASADYSSESKSLSILNQLNYRSKNG